MNFGFPCRQENEEVYYVDSSFATIRQPQLAELKKLAARNVSGKARLCLHSSPGAELHEMFIVHRKETYVRPHRHLTRSEGLMVLEGMADLIVFSEQGTITKLTRLDRECFHIRLDSGHYHMLIIRSDFFVFYEATTGPFDIKGTVFAPWSPSLDNPLEIKRFSELIEAQIAEANSPPTT